ncbi:hypothetical protein [Paraburkholderia phosphatilytica]|uniref:hypothetical protein n=1 Tax=Paraburkholderia phosphatilytica TaxID=2282883 RepID=UPI000F5F4DBA|nr:hypothetical protein [Paraburkholderia phosphatilytica]
MTNAAINPTVNLAGIVDFSSSHSSATADDSSFPVFAPESGEQPANPGAVDSSARPLSFSYQAMDAETRALRSTASKKATTARAALAQRPSPVTQHVAVADQYGGVLVTFTNSRKQFKALTGIESKDAARGVCTAKYTANHGVVVGVFDGSPFTLTHECVHASHVIMKTVGIDARNDSGEAQAYLTEWLSKEGANVLVGGGAATATEKTVAAPVKRLVSDLTPRVLNRAATDVSPAVKPGVGTQTRDLMCATADIIAKIVKYFDAELKRSADKDTSGTNSAYTVTPEEEARNEELERQQRVQQAAGDSMDTYFRDPEVHHSMDDCFRDSSGLSMNDYFER